MKDRRVTLILAVAALGFAVALVLFAVGTLHGQDAQKAVATARGTQLADARDQVKVLRRQRDLANTRADDVTRIALAGIRDLRCVTYRQTQATAVFARLVFASPNATDDQRKLVAPFVMPPAKPKGCR